MSQNTAHYPEIFGRRYISGYTLVCLLDLADRTVKIECFNVCPIHSGSYIIRLAWMKWMNAVFLRGSQDITAIMSANFASTSHLNYSCKEGGELTSALSRRWSVASLNSQYPPLVCVRELKRSTYRIVFSTPPRILFAYSSESCWPSIFSF
jgi:hypothetical protein